MKHCIAILAILSVLFSTSNENHIKLFLGGSSNSKSKLQTVQFFPDFRESFTLITVDSFECNQEDDCEIDKTVSYHQKYATLNYKYFTAKININFKEARMIKNIDFNYVVYCEEKLTSNVIGLNRNSEFLRHHFEQSGYNLDLLKISFRDKNEIKMSVGSPYLKRQAKKFSYYTDSRNQQQFYLETMIKLTQSDENKIIFEKTLRLCPFSNPALTDWSEVFFSGSKSMVDSLRTVFKDVNFDDDKFRADLVHKNTGFILRLDNAFLEKNVFEMFKINYHDSDDCDLYFGFKFTQFYNIDFLVAFDKQNDVAELYFQTFTEIPKPFAYWILGIGFFLMLAFLVYVLKTRRVVFDNEKMKENNELEESLKMI